MSNHKKKRKKTFYGRTDRRTTQNFSSEPHKIFKNSNRKQFSPFLIERGKIVIEKELHRARLNFH